MPHSWLPFSTVLSTLKNAKIVSGCGTVGRAVTSETGGLRIEASHRHLFTKHACKPGVGCALKTKIKK